MMPVSYLQFLAILLGSLLWILPVAAQMPYYPNDPYFEPAAEGLASGYPGQWHLYNQMPVVEGVNAGLDINILGAWQLGYTGQGVVIGILDDGVDALHPDLADSFRNAYSWDFRWSREQNLLSPHRGVPLYSSNYHGTAVAGVAAAVGGNGIGMSGVAPAAGVASLAILERSYLGLEYWEMDIAAILFHGQLGNDGQPDPFVEPDWDAGVSIKIKNHSYMQEYESYMPTKEALLQAYTESMAHGVIHVTAAANNRTPLDEHEWINFIDTGKMANHNLPGMLTVAAIGVHGKFASYSNYGSNVLVTAPGGDYEPEGYRVHTTDRTGVAGYNDEYAGATDPFFDPSLSDSEVLAYTAKFMGTSASSPIVAGVLALAVEANPHLNARAAQHILVRTSRVIDPEDTTREGGWVTNAAGYAFNRNYGFGLIDATAVVQMAAERGYASDPTHHYSGEIQVQESFSDTASSLSILYQAQVPVALWQPLEYVLVHLQVSGLQTDLSLYGTGTGDGVGTILGDLEAWLTSPSGTRQMLFADDRALLDSHAAARSHLYDRLDWEFLSYAYWGEDPNGEWTLELLNHTGNVPTGIWESVAFSIGMGDWVTPIPEPATASLLLGLLWVCTVALHRTTRRGQT